MEYLSFLPVEHKNTMPIKIGPSIGIAQFPKICRTCLAEGDHNSIFESTCEQITIPEILKMLVGVQIAKVDRLPHNICSSCINELIRIYNFLEKCRHSQTILQSILDLQFENNSDLKYEESMDGNTQNEDDSSNDSYSNVELDEEPVENEAKKTAPKKRIKHGLPFRCRDCPVSYDTRELLQTHRKESNHKERRNRTCHVCHKMFTTSKLREHMRCHTNERPFQCTVCGKRFSLSGNLNRHLLIHSEEKPHVCEVCGKGFCQAVTLQKHKTIHTRSQSDSHFICNYCGRGFKIRSYYNIHLKKHSAGDGFKRQKVDHPREHKCRICKRGFKTKHHLKAHQQVHEEKKYLCSGCGKGFVTKGNLQSHMRSHTGERPYNCNVCEKSFVHVSSLETHLLVHTGQKPYKCHMCPKAFTQQSNLKFHLLTHRGEKPHACSYCGKRFALKGNLTVHTRIHTGETPYVCSICQKGFHDSSSMKNHEKGHKEFDFIFASQLIDDDDNVESILP